MKNTNKDKNCSEIKDSGIFEAILALNRHRRMIALRYGVGPDEVAPNLGHAAESLLLAIETEPKAINLLAKEVGVDQSWMSRAVSALVKRDLVVSQQDPKDARGKIISITSKGRIELVNADKIVNKVTEELLGQNINKKERELFEHYFETINDGFDNFRINKRQSRCALHHEFNRMARGLGVFGSDIFSLGLHFMQIHVLHLLAGCCNRETPVHFLLQKLPLSQSALSRVLMSLADFGLVDRHADPMDLRASLWSITTAGEDKLNAVIASGAKKLAPGLRKLSQKQCRDFYRIIDALVDKKTTDKKIPQSAKSNITIRQSRTILPKATSTDKCYEIFLDSEAHGEIKIANNGALISISSKDLSKKHWALVAKFISSQ